MNYVFFCIEGPEATNYSFIHIGVGVLLTLLLLAGLVIFFVFRERKRSRKLARDPFSGEYQSHDVDTKSINSAQHKPFRPSFRANQNHISKNSGDFNPNSASLRSMSGIHSSDTDLRHAKSFVDVSNNQHPQVSNFHHCQHSHSQSHLPLPTPPPKPVLLNGGTPKCRHHMRSHMRPPGASLAHSPASLRAGEFEGILSNHEPTVCHVHHGGGNVEGMHIAYPHVVHMHPLVHRGLVTTCKGGGQTRSFSIASGTLNSSTDEGNMTREKMQKISIV